ncbi:unnamed protein product [Paramecium octaurelia]|uniref:Uncharacterized protein n=1 Tax=Paramecium octaurelia TaxID=43137 RepID=A0A8S1WHE1_PAROT|nr:unnamed protein product [Paramecium octaurelia]
MCDVHDIALGHNTTEIRIRNEIPQEFDMFCFSIITTRRLVDIKVTDLKIKSKWINYLRAIIINRRELEAQRAEEKKRTQRRMRKRDQKYCQKGRSFLKSPKSSQSSQCIKKFISLSQEDYLIKSYIRQKINTKLFYSNQSEVNNESNIQQEMIVHGKKNKSKLLMILWKFGLPDFARRTLWPIIIGNNLKSEKNSMHTMLMSLNLFKKDELQSIYSHQREYQKGKTTISFHY